MKDIIEALENQKITDNWVSFKVPRKLRKIKIKHEDKRLQNIIMFFKTITILGSNDEENWEVLEKTRWWNKIGKKGHYEISNPKKVKWIKVVLKGRIKTKDKQ